MHGAGLWGLGTRTGAGGDAAELVGDGSGGAGGGGGGGVTLLGLFPGHGARGHGLKLAGVHGRLLPPHRQKQVRLRLVP